ncbi:DUF624 domain-containing protein [Flaviflexus salsibiostraticola]|uniref:DUF624 domain-containing protein n=1 Tax=Flaviflexus salsibiostraticola TaxID=1282737 RepID=A0A3Q8WTD3_9ACTO|nr:DUF624 domain-containing protein [Flaviflexus salsibiostraticola]AZN29560.1 DUF624 domain-containing protein [Flaviflexus salsibiostraticola]
MGGWLAPDSKLYNGLVTVADTVIVNLLLIAFSIPIVTAGAAVTGAHRALLQQAREEGSSPARAFWSGFRSTFWRSTLVWLVLLTLFTVSAWEIWAISRMNLGVAGNAVIVVVLTGIVLLAGFAVWIFPLLSEQMGPLGRVVRGAALLAIRHLPRTLAALGLLLVQPLILYLSIDVLGLLVFGNLIILPAAILYMHALMFSGPLKKQVS